MVFLLLLQDFIICLKTATVFDGLSVEQKAKYNNSFEQFIFNLGQHPKADPVPDPVEVKTDVKE